MRPVRDHEPWHQGLRRRQGGDDDQPAHRICRAHLIFISESKRQCRDYFRISTPGRRAAGRRTAQHAGTSRWLRHRGDVPARSGEPHL
nr:hypothetical protein SHINE37_120373 [Rhizobiaceae bacterium]